jgi:glycosyltransferase involved in cell wall biosynthesis
MRKVLFVKNIIPPYRISLFNNLQKEILPSDNLEVNVYVFDRNESGRHWYLEEKDLKFNYIIDDTGFYRSLRGFNFRFNPAFFKQILGEPLTHLILGSSWNDPNIIATIILKRLGIVKNPLSFWSEANYHTKHRSLKPDSWFKKRFRKFIMNSCDQSFLLPGKIARTTIFEHWKVNSRPTIYFPNLPANNYLIENRPKMNNLEEDGLFKIIIVARHNEQHKGVLKFLKNLDSLEGLLIYLAGDGKDTELYRRYLTDNNLEKKVIFLGNLNSDELISYYLKSNLFVLPSNYDQSPLAIVEAASQGMPLFVSERCGNHPELVNEGVNGFIFNPDNAYEINHKLDKFKDLSKFKLNQMGQNSKDLIRLNYDSKKVLRNFIDKI